eukprot:300091-Amphidinium_carterae.1
MSRAHNAKRMFVLTSCDSWAQIPYPFLLCRVRVHFPKMVEEEVAALFAEGSEGEETTVVAAKAATVPIKPTQAMVRDHMIAHIPNRLWCVHCVSRARVDAHHTVKGHDEETTTV